MDSSSNHNDIKCSAQIVKAAGVSNVERRVASVPYVIVIGGGFAGVAAARAPHNASIKNPLAPLIGKLGLPLYRTSGDNSVLYDHDLESYALFDMEGKQVSLELVTEVGEHFESILKEGIHVFSKHI